MSSIVQRANMRETRRHRTRQGSHPDEPVATHSGSTRSLRTFPPQAGLLHECESCWAAIDHGQHDAPATVPGPWTGVQRCLRPPPTERRDGLAAERAGQRPSCSRTSAVTAPPSARPRASRMTCPTMTPIGFMSPERSLSATSGLAARAAATIGPSSSEPPDGAEAVRLDDRPRVLPRRPPGGRGPAVRPRESLRGPSTIPTSVANAAASTETAASSLASQFASGCASAGSPCASAASNASPTSGRKASRRALSALRPEPPPGARRARRAARAWPHGPLRASRR